MEPSLRSARIVSVIVLALAFLIAAIVFVNLRESS